MAIAHSLGRWRDRGGVILLGYIAMIGLGLLPLAAVARATGVDAERMFFLPTTAALTVAFVIGLAVCLVVGRVLGVLRFEHLHSYEDRRVRQKESGTARRRRRPLGEPRYRRAREATR
ncbi:MAG: hypothetical protein M0R73_06320 [Dehalococcoidia bacterium]|nr:hypothetical protein [Dehalococcoidia bacterium]